MKPFIKMVFLLLLLTCLAVPQPVFANSGPVYWQGYPSSEVLAADEDCPIEVKKEKLLFNLDDGSAGGITAVGRVSASYSMVNPTENDMEVRMAFPVISSIADFSPDDVSITSDDTGLPYDLYIGDATKGEKYSPPQTGDYILQFGDILTGISCGTYKARNFSGNEKGKLYTIEVKPNPGQRINLDIKFKMEPGKTKILSNGFNGYSWDGGNGYCIDTWCEEARILQIYILGNDVDFSVSAYSDGSKSQKIDLFKYDVSKEEVELMPYLMTAIKAYKEIDIQRMNNTEAYAMNDTQMYNLYATALDGMFSSNPYVNLEALIQQDYYQRVLTLVYIVDFPAGSERNVTVSYKTSGTMDKTKTSEPIYTFYYLLNPARKWRSFGSFDIEVVTPEMAPYIVQSSIQFEKAGNRHYKAVFDALPEKDLVFTICQGETMPQGKPLYALNEEQTTTFLIVILALFVTVLSISAIPIIRKIKSRG